MSKNNKKGKKKSEIINLTRFIYPNSTDYDPQGMYTGVPNEVFYDHRNEMPIQDADDL